MSVIGKPNTDKLNPLGNVNVPAMEMPSFRYLLADERKTLKNVLIQSPYALGDCVCAEPAIRYAVKNFEGCEVSLVTPFPELYRHIPLKRVYKSSLEKPEWDKYYVLRCYYGADELQSEFVQNFNMAIGDYIATCLFKGMLPVADRNIILMPSDIELMPARPIVIHAGKHWVSKTFPKKWWDAVIQGLVKLGHTPVLIGAKVDDGKRGYVEVDTNDCTDLRDKLTIMQSVSLLQNANVVLTNDSAPLHMAASGNAQIGYFSTVRHPDFVTHWRPTFTTRENTWGYRMRDLSNGHMWKRSDVTPNRNGGKYDVIDYETLMSWLPKPEQVIEWTDEYANLSGLAKSVVANFNDETRKALNLNSTETHGRP